MRFGELKRGRATAADIHGVSNRFKVCWIDAQSMRARLATRARLVAVMAKVVEHKTVGNGADEELVRDAMSDDACSIIVGHSAIAA